jgi:hypothetical protein
MQGEPSIAAILPYLAAPAVLFLVLLAFARRRGASWTQVQVSFGAAMLGAFLTVTGWSFASYLSGETLSVWRILGSELLVSAVCGLTAYFAAMPIERDLTEELRESDRRGTP